MSELKIIFGTRPEWIKLEPVVNRLKIPFEVICTGQHTDLLEGMPPMRIDHNLEIKSDGNVFGNLARILRGLELHIADFTDIVLVQGDTISTFAGALAAKQAGARLIHLEAGIRSGCLHDPWPEEQIRRGISEMADLHLAPTSHTVSNLIEEGIDVENICLTGNTIVTSIHEAMMDFEPDSIDVPFVLLTMHRREFYQAHNFAEKLQKLFAFIGTLHTKVIWPVHPATAQVVMVPNKPNNLEFTKPMPRKEFTHLLAAASRVMTDSGGVAEEATILGIPLIVMREHNDRYEIDDPNLDKRIAKDTFGSIGAADKAVEAITAFTEDKGGM